MTVDTRVVLASKTWVTEPWPAMAVIKAASLIAFQVPWRNAGDPLTPYPFGPGKGAACALIAMIASKIATFCTSDDIITNPNEIRYWMSSIAPLVPVCPLLKVAII